eukprot:363758-Chlamydomonas_euryale.AAC.9
MKRSATHAAQPRGVPGAPNTAPYPYIIRLPLVSAAAGAVRFCCGSAMAAPGSGVFADLLSASGAYKYYADGEWKESTSGKTVGVTNPSTREPAFQFQGARARPDEGWVRGCTVRGWHAAPRF